MLRNVGLFKTIAPILVRDDSLALFLLQIVFVVVVDFDDDDDDVQLLKRTHEYTHTQRQ